MSPSPPKKHTHLQSLPISFSFQPLATTNLLFIYVDLPFLDIPCKLICIICSFFCLASFTYYDGSRFTHAIESIYLPSWSSSSVLLLGISKFRMQYWIRTRHLEPDILECEVKRALGSITMNKASGGDGIPVELFQMLKDDVVKVLHSICQQIWKPQQWPQDWKRLVFIPVPKKGIAKKCSNYHTIALISHASKVMLRILQARHQRYVNHELPDVQAGFRKGRGTRHQIANIH